MQTSEGTLDVPMPSAQSGYQAQCQMQSCRMMAAVVTCIWLPEVLCQRLPGTHVPAIQPGRTLYPCPFHVVLSHTKGLCVRPIGSNQLQHQPVWVHTRAATHRLEDTHRHPPPSLATGMGDSRFGHKHKGVTRFGKPETAQIPAESRRNLVSHKTQSTSPDDGAGKHFADSSPCRLGF